MRRRRRSCARLAAPGALALSAWLGACDAEPVVEAAPPTVAWTALRAHAGATGEARPGIVRSASRTELGFEAGGRLVSRAVDVGDAVAQGDELAALDGSELELRVASAEADVQSAAARRDGAVRDEARIEGLAEDEAVARAQVESAADERQAAEAALDLARAQLAAARRRRADARLVAPFDGVIVAADADVGDTVAPGQAVLGVADPARLEVVVDVPPSRAASIRTGAPATVVPELRPAGRIDAAVTRIAPLADPVTRGIRITVALAGDTGSVRPGSEVEVSFPDGEAPRVRVPERAVVRDAGERTDRVWTLDRSASPARVRAVDVAVPASGLVPIAPDLGPGAEVVVSGAALLVDGQSVTPAREPLR